MVLKKFQGSVLKNINTYNIYFTLKKFKMICILRKGLNIIMQQANDLLNNIAAFI
jgi:hypothetical protein